MGDELFKHLRSGLFAVMGRRLGIAGLVKVVNSLLQIFYPWLLRQVLLSVEKSQMGEEVVGSFGYWMAALLFLAMASKAITENLLSTCLSRWLSVQGGRVGIGLRKIPAIGRSRTGYDLVGRAR